MSQSLIFCFFFFVISKGAEYLPHTEIGDIKSNNEFNLGDNLSQNQYVLRLWVHHDHTIFSEWDVKDKGFFCSHMTLETPDYFVSVNAGAYIPYLKARKIKMRNREEDFRHYHKHHTLISQTINTSPEDIARIENKIIQSGGINKLSGQIVGIKGSVLFKLKLSERPPGAQSYANCTTSILGILRGSHDKAELVEIPGRFKMNRPDELGIGADFVSIAGSAGTMAVLGTTYAALMWVSIPVSVAAFSYSTYTKYIGWTKSGYQPQDPNIWGNNNTPAPDLAFHFLPDNHRVDSVRIYKHLLHIDSSITHIVNIEIK